MYVTDNKKEDIAHCFGYFHQCFWHFPQFRDDFKVLYDEGIIRRISFDKYEWTETKTSLAEYFLKIRRNKDKKRIPGGFWNPIETAFGVDRKTLSHLGSKMNTGNKESPSFKRVYKLILKNRENIKRQAEQEQKKHEQEQKDMKAFFAVKMFIEKADGKDIKEIRSALEKIKTVLS